MSDREALRRIRPRTLRDKNSLLWSFVCFVLIVLFVLFVGSVIHISPLSGKDLRVTQTPDSHR
ncbi:hypothetical protein [Granulicella sp. L46]|uniref:hypothetical protein n=1 Tax=Granulicella sp. L46 TaxID=1641865 RepID=UPI00131C7C1A|nr:hypothetical protein [Granulicella sp. L46]